MASRGELVFNVEEEDESRYLCFIDRLRRSFPTPLGPLQRLFGLKYTDVTVQTNSHRIKLRIRHYKLCLVGYQMENPKQWLEFGSRNEREDWAKRMTSPEQHRIKGSSFLDMACEYDKLESATGGRTMDGIRIGRQQLVDAVNLLATSGCRTERARSLIVVSLMICEGCRHPLVFEYLATTFCDSLPPPPWMLELVLSNSSECVATLWEQDRRALAVAKRRKRKPRKQKLRKRNNADIPDLEPDGIYHDPVSPDSNPGSARSEGRDELDPNENNSELVANGVNHVSDPREEHLEPDLNEGNRNHDPREDALDLGSDRISHDSNPRGNGPSSVQNANGLELAPNEDNPHSCVSDGNPNSDLNGGSSKLEHDDADLGCDMTGDSTFLLLDPGEIFTNLQRSNADPDSDESSRKLKPVENHVDFNLVQDNPFFGLYPDDIFTYLHPSKDNVNPDLNGSSHELEPEEDNFEADAIKDNPLLGLDPDEIFSDLPPREDCGQAESNSSTDPASSSSSECSWVEVFSMRVTSDCGKEPSRFFGIITVRNGSHPECVYKRERDESDWVHLGEMLPLNVPHLTVSADRFCIGFSITDEDFRSMLGIKSWYYYDDKSDEPLCADFYGEYCSVRVYFIPLSYAMQVAIEITFVDEGRKGHARVYGKISASCGCFDDHELVLFQKTAKEYTNASPGERMKLLRYVISVPTNSSLLVRIELYEHGDLSFDDVIAKGNMEFPLTDYSASERAMSRECGKLQIKVLLS